MRASQVSLEGKDEEKELEAEDEEGSDGILNLSGDEAEWGSWNSEQADRRGKKRLTTSGLCAKERVILVAKHLQEIPLQVEDIGSGCIVLRTLDQVLKSARPEICAGFMARTSVISLWEKKGKGQCTST